MEPECSGRGPGVPAGGGSRPRVVVASAERFSAEAARILAESLEAAAEGRRPADAPVSFALAGGSTPRPVYEHLAGLAVPWHALEVYFGDERCVPPEDPASNYGMAKKALLDRVSFPLSRTHPMACGTEDPEAAADGYARLLPERLDLLVLGIGTDGHTASLFPGAPTLGELSRRVVPARASEGPRLRLTVTPPVIRDAGRIVVLAAGSAKAEAVLRALEGPFAPELCPAQLARSGTWVLDRDAAGRLRLPTEEAADASSLARGASAPGPDR